MSALFNKRGQTIWPKVVVLEEGNIEVKAIAFHDLGQSPRNETIGQGYILHIGEIEKGVINTLHWPETLYSVNYYARLIRELEAMVGSQNLKITLI